MVKDRHPILSAYSWLNALSIDVCAGAIAGGTMASVLLDTNIAWAYWLILPIAVWLIYTADHLIDGYRTMNRRAHFRHNFHHKNYRSLILISILLAIIAALLSFSYLPYEVIIFGIALGGLAVIYLALVFAAPGILSVFFQKELLVALFYTAGIWGPVIIMNQGIGIDHALILLIFLLVAYQDLIMLSMIEIKADSTAGQGSFPISFGYRRSRVLFYAIAATVFSLALIAILYYPDALILKAALVLALMQGGLILIFRFASKLHHADLYRYLSEALFFMPALMLL